MEQPVSETASKTSFGTKVFDAVCKVTLMPQQPLLEALAEIWTLGLLVKPNSGSTVFIPYTDASKVEASNFRASITTSNGQAIGLSQFGTKFDHFAQKLMESYGDALARALLMEEAVTVYEAPCYYSLLSMGSSTKQAPSQCRARIYETALVILPYNSIPVRIPFSKIKSVSLEGYKLRLSLDQGVVEFTRLANLTQFFVDKLIETMKKLEASSIETIRSIVPSTTFDELQKLSWLMVEGRAASRKDVEDISEDIWRKIEKTVEVSPLAEAYHHLSTLGERELTCIGLRKAKDSVYMWFMIPVMGSTSSGGNAVVLEVTSETGHATYLFRVMPGPEFPNASQEEFGRDTDILNRDLNEAIIAIGFRREPIYLTEDQLNTQEYSRYLYASEHLESLKFLRERFFGRVIHNTFEQWKTDLTDALIFNTSAEDGTRWSRSKLDFIEPSQEQQTQATFIPSTVEEMPLPNVSAVKPLVQDGVQNLNLDTMSVQFMADRVVSLSRMDADDRGNVKLCLHDPEFDYDVWVTIPGDEAMKLGAFPGSKIKLTLQKA